MGESSDDQKRMLVLRSNDGAEFEIQESIAAKGSGLIQRMIDDECTEGGVPLSLPQINGTTLAKVVEFWRRHSEGDEGSKESKRWDDEFAEMMDRDNKFDAMHAANFLESQDLLDLLSQSVADHIKDMSVEEVRDYFNIENDFSPEEEEELRQKYAWAFE